MKWESFKNRLNKESKEQELPVDIDAIWNAIEPQVDELNDQKGDRKRIFFWMFFGLGLAMMVAWGITTTDYFNADIAAAKNVESTRGVGEKESELENYNKVVTDGSETEDQSEISNQNSEIANQNTTNTENDKATILNQNAETITKLRETSSDIAGNPIQQKTTIPTEEISKNTFVKKETKNSTSDLLTQSVAVEAKDNAQNKTSKTIVREDIVSISGIEKSDELISTSGTTNTTAERLSEASANKTIEAKKINPLLLATLLAKIHQQVPALKGEQNLKKENNSEPEIFAGSDDDDKRKKKKTYQILFGINGGVSYANRNLSQKEGSTSTLLENRKAYESSLETSHAGLFMGVQHTSGLRLTMGLQRTSIAERYTYERMDETEQMINGVQVRRVNLEGDTIDIMGEIPLTTTYNIEKNIYNRYMLLDLPILLSYHKNFGKWNAGVEAGVLVNLSLKTEGIVPNALLEDVDIKENIFQSSVGLSYQFGLSLERMLTDKLSLSFAPNVRIYPNDFSASDYELSQKYTLFGGNLGLIYRL